MHDHTMLQWGRAMRVRGGGGGPMADGNINKAGSEVAGHAQGEDSKVRRQPHDKTAHRLQHA